MLYARIFQPVVRLLVAGFLLGSGFPSQAIAKMQGHFSGEPILQPTGDGRNMRLVEDFSYTDANGATWTAQKGTVTDGASIPTALWPIIGSPFTGKYLNAAIIHDHFCANQRRPWQQVHRLFHEGMLAGGVGQTMAKMMYAGVYAFGPRWRDEAGWCFGTPCAEAGVSLDGATAQHQFNQSVFEEAQHLAQRSDSSLDEIDRLIDRRFQNEMKKRNVYDAKSSPYTLKGEIQFDEYYSAQKLNLAKQEGVAFDLALSYILLGRMKTYSDFCVKWENEYPNRECKRTIYGDPLPR
jgi:Protein of unknown function (DUF1353)